MMDSRQLIQMSEGLVRRVEEIEEKLGTDISAELHEELFRELEKIQAGLKEVQAEVPSINVFTQVQINALIDGLDERIITLYGRIDNQWIEAEIVKVKEEALALEQKIQKGELTKAEEALLREKVAEICKNYRLLKKDRKVIAFAKEVLKKAAGELPPEKPPATPHCCIEECEKDEMAIELFEIADLFHQHKNRCAQIKFNQLSDYPKKRVQAYLAKEGNITQAILQAAFEIADSGEMSEFQLEALFREADLLKLEELVQSDLSFKSRVSLTG